MPSEEMGKTYEPREVESRWSAFWLRQGLFHAKPSLDKGKNFCIVIPPPNVTGSLHMGHALNNTLQDILVRFKRMDGFEVLWVPGTDHAGIATQNVVERELMKEKKRRQDLGREKFVEEVWRWKERHGNQIIHQLKRLGASCDWDRERFTMDEGLSRAVREAFVRLHEQGLIYRDLYLINWCPRCLTALSDLEVEHQEQEGHLWYIRYGPLTVATTRPETMLGDTAVAVHPDDGRYTRLVGRTVELPLVGRKIPVIADHRVDPDFGTGAVKVTPAHDFNDFVFGINHKLPRINLFTPDAQLNENGIHFAGLDRFEARKRVVAELEEKGFLEKIEKHKSSVGHCYRCKTVVEPYLSLQWFVRTRPLAERALEAVREGKTRFHPENWTKTYEQWMESIKDWCISRQIWWGHRIPAWYCEGGECPPIVARTTPEKCPHCGSKNLRQDEDVLDTWFSSALWPFSTLGWPEETPELKAFYPTSVLVTGFDIIFFWVARMMMMGIEFMGDVPFRDVYIHALVRDIHGQKMSKSKGNVIDPLSVMDRFGTDAFRFTLAALAAQGRDIKLSEEVIEGYRNFCNKIWNAARYSLGKLDSVGAPFAAPPPLDPSNLSPIDKWILAAWDQTVTKVRESIETYHFDDAAKALYQFFWHTFCDWYLEFSKIRFNPAVLYHLLESSLRAMHPFLPFITEEIWHKLMNGTDGKGVDSYSVASLRLGGEMLPRWGGLGEENRDSPPHVEPKHPALPVRGGLGMTAYPQASGWDFEKEGRLMERLVEVIDALRTIRGENRIPVKAEIAPIFRAEDSGLQRFLEENSDLIGPLALARRPQWAKEKVVPKQMAHIALAGLDLYVPLEGLVDLVAERKRLEKEIGKLGADCDRRRKRLADQNFIQRADPEVVEEERGRLKETQTKLARLEETLGNIA